MRPGPLAKYAADLASLPADAALGYRLEGLRGVWQAVAPRTVHRLIRASRLTIYAQPLTQIPDIPVPPGIAIRPLRAEEIPALGAIAGGRERERFRRLLAAGCRGLVAWRGCRPVGYAWMAPKMGPEVSRCPLELPPHAAYLWDLYVVPAERCNGIGGALSSERLRIARALGRTEGWRMIEPGNFASLRTLQRSGGTPRVVGELRYLKLGRRLFARVTPCPPTH